ncbi:hypothetical protein CU097_014197 [Rhizopus azygosporus]|uniref:Uncharacterized protein n=1 Tax=Rhizopus azygosporus TaxID=86630 RepID=A0A367K2R6_RHIAZ|nr:hypothetical protein CU097_014197 [Rhizopus azygosporus]
MTELCLTKATVKLPKKTRNNSCLREIVSDILVKERVYFDGCKVTKDDIIVLFKDYDPIKVDINQIEGNVCSGYIQFRTKEIADRVYALFNCIKSDVELQLKINPPYKVEPEVEANVLYIQNLSDKMSPGLIYDLFRPFGPINSCKMSEGSTTALLQYFKSKNAYDAQRTMNGKLIHNNVITVTHLNTTKLQTTELKTNTKAAKSNIPVDYTNLYIKNLDLEVKSADLFKHFRKYGHIISARVMKHPQTKQSRGFGFVSFSKTEEAMQAKEGMNGQFIASKPIIVAFHEPKKAKSEDNQSPDSNSSNHSAPVASYHPRSTTPTDKLKYSSSMNSNAYNNGLPLKRQVSAPIHHQPTYTPSGLFIPAPLPTQQNRPTLRRSGSIESVTTAMTETNTQLKRQAIIQAIFTMNQQEQNLQDIVDMLLTLKKKDLATCLFNKAFLLTKIKQAKEALEIFQEEEQQQQPFQQQHQQQQQQQVQMQNFYYHLPNIEIPPRCSRAIPIVAPPDAGVKPKKQKESDSKDLKEEIEKFLETLKDLASYEQKQLLGDRLFPLVKATGVKHAPRVTIRLLDTIPIQELAHSMYDKHKLQQLVNNAPINK